MYMYMCVCVFCIFFNIFFICKTHQALDTARTIVNEWLSMYPDPTINPTHGWGHTFRKLGDQGNWRYTWFWTSHHSTLQQTITWSGRTHQSHLPVDAYLAFLGQMELDEKTWPKYAKMIQTQINRTPTKSRGNKSSIEITTGIKPKQTFDHILFEGHSATLQKNMAKNSDLVQKHVSKFIKGLQQTWGEVARTRNHKVMKNKRQRTKKHRKPAPQTLPMILCSWDPSMHSMHA